MKIDRDTLVHLAELAGLEINPSQEHQILENLQKAVSWVEKLSELDLKNTPPLMTMSSESTVLREDKPVNELSREELLDNAPSTAEGYFLVPRAIEKATPSKAASTPEKDSGGPG